VNVPKSLFVLSSNSAAIFNFMLTLVIYFGFMVFCHVSFGIHLLMMIFPILCLIIFNIGMSYILSSLFVFFRDMQYLYQIFTMLLMYMSAIFYEIDRFPENLRFVFDINPIYHFVTYIRQLVIYATVPDFTSHIICLAFAFGMLAARTAAVASMGFAKNLRRKVFEKILSFSFKNRAEICLLLLI
jgi:ABC-2 type transport system permease protein